MGLLVRDHLMKLLLEAVKRGTCEHLEVQYNELNHQVLPCVLPCVLPVYMPVYCLRT